MSYNKKNSDTCVRLGPVRFGYAHVFEPKIDENEAKAAAAAGREPKGKYSTCIMIPKSDTDTIKMIEAAIEAAKQKGKTSKWGGKIPGRLSLPLRDGDEEDKGEEYENMMFFNCSSSRKPGVCVWEDGKPVEALDEDDFYSGCWGAVAVNFYPFSANGNNGVGAGLNNVIKTRDDERLAGGSTAEQDFADLADDLLN